MVLVPPQVYFLLQAHGQDPGLYWRFLGRFLGLRLAVGFPAFVRGADPDGPFELGHLWFLYDLLLYSLLLFPVFLYLRHNLDRAGDVAGRAVPTLLGVPAPGAAGRADRGGARHRRPRSWHSYVHAVFLLYGFLLYGFLIAADHRLGELLNRNWGRALMVGVAALPGMFIIAFYDLAEPPGGRDRPRPLERRLAVPQGHGGLGIDLRHRAASASSRTRPREPVAQGAPRAAGYASEAVLPFYVLHQTPIVLLGFYVLPGGT